MPYYYLARPVDGVIESVPSVWDFGTYIGLDSKPRQTHRWDTDKRLWLGDTHYILWSTIPPPSSECARQENEAT